jgi:hypothetical protein
LAVSAGEEKKFVGVGTESSVHPGAGVAALAEDALKAKTTSAVVSAPQRPALFLRPAETGRMKSPSSAPLTPEFGDAWRKRMSILIALPSGLYWLC